MNRWVRMLLHNLGRLPGGYYRLCRYARHPERYTEEERWSHVRWVMSSLAQGGNVDLVVTGRENVPPAGGCVLYGNHQGLFDVVAIAATSPVPLGAVYKKELANVPGLKQIYACTNSFAMDREDVRQSLTVIRQVTEEVEKGRNYLIFPEGTRSRRGNVQGEYHAGSFRAAMKARCPIVPLALINSYLVLDQPGSDRVQVQLHYLKPVPYEEYRTMSTTEVAKLVRDRIEAVIQQALGQ